MTSSRNTWVPLPPHTLFGMYNLPYGIFQNGPNTPLRTGVAIGDKVLDLAKVADLGFFEGIISSPEIFHRPFLNDFMAEGKKVWDAVRERIIELLAADCAELIPFAQIVLHPMASVQMSLPVAIGDYTDFYASEYHATNVGEMFRGKDNALFPNWKHLPVGYHGRASSIVVSGTHIHRPYGQTLPEGASQPIYGPSEKLDFELEMAFIVGKASQPGQQVPIQGSEEYIFGMVLLNDWSARDIQKWEYVPLGPFLGKSFATTISPWVVPLAALNPFKVDGPIQIPAPLPYLKTTQPSTYDISLEVALHTADGHELTISKANFKDLYWSIGQQLAHHSVNGCNLRVGDLMASGTISGPDRNNWGSLLEITWNGQQPIALPNGTTRTFLQDNDTVVLKGIATKGDIVVGFGEAAGKIVPADEIYLPR